jgi:hypothetical protein
MDLPIRPRQPKPRIRLPAAPWPGYKRQWVQCRQCGRVAFYDFVPYSLSNPLMTLPCGHGLTLRIHTAARSLLENEAIPLFIEQRIAALT